jgi:hypothetical protein
MALPGYLAVLSSLIILPIQQGFISSRRISPELNNVPFLGNLHHLPTNRPELKLTEFAHEFGEITGLKLGRQNLVIFNTWQAVRDLVEQKGSIYS